MMNNVSVETRLPDVGEKNLWLGVSISIKPYSDTIARQCVDIVANNSAERGLILVADEIAAINYRVLSGYSEQGAKNKAYEVGQTYVERYSDIIAASNVQNIDIVRWCDVWSPRHSEMYDVLRAHYERDPEFRDEVQAPLLAYLQIKGRTVTDERIDRMSEYILRELPSLLDGVEYNGCSYKYMIYPTYRTTGLRALVNDVQTGIRFSGLKNDLHISGDHTLCDLIIDEP